MDGAYLCQRENPRIWIAFVIRSLQSGCQLCPYIQDVPEGSLEKACSSSYKSCSQILIVTQGRFLGSSGGEHQYGQVLRMPLMEHYACLCL